MTSISYLFANQLSSEKIINDQVYQWLNANRDMGLLGIEVTSLLSGEFG